MRLLKVFLIIVALLCLAVVLVGTLKPSVSYGHEIKVNKPIEYVWKVLQDDSQYDQWLNGFKSIEHLTGEYNKVGSTYKVIVNPGEGQEDFEMIETLMSIKENDHITLHFDSDMMVFEQTTYLKEVDGLTSVRTDSKVKGKGVIMRAMFAAMETFTGSFTAGETKNIEALKVLLEK